MQVGCCCCCCYGNRICSGIQSGGVADCVFAAFNFCQLVNRLISLTRRLPREGVSSCGLASSAVVRYDCELGRRSLLAGMQTARTVASKSGVRLVCMARCGSN